jgi:hypothetical protein
MMVTAVKDLRIKKGSAGSHAFQCDDGRTYFVKFNDDTRTVVNEHIGYSLAKFLSLPVPESRHVIVPQALIEGSEDLRERGVVAGEHHGTLLMEGCVDFKGLSVRDLVITNSRTFPGLIVLDNLVVNMDRNNEGNNLVHATPSGELEYMTVDFSEILSGRNWTVETLKVAKTTSYLVPVFPIMTLPVKGLASFSPWLEQTEALPEGMVDRILSEVPASWNVGEEEGAAVRDLLLSRRSLVRGILEKNKARFLNWR